MRADLYLKYVNLVARRVLSKSFIESGNVLINDKIAKPSSQIKDGDTLTIYMGNTTLIIEASIKQEGKKILVGGTVIDKLERGIYQC
ncbi:MAG: RNA-binding S4 domain-containing protein [Erysipelotrichia bacterium]|jgi:ribosomal 50S subunit-recycling heat shock protein|nr:S4 domain-containing protein [Bacilli bacterium]NLB49567.1 RNA-binding S4 domain-containing protein [Erysipelotrichia bacterium]